MPIAPLQTVVGLLCNPVAVPAPKFAGMDPGEIPVAKVPDGSVSKVHRAISLANALGPQPIVAIARSRRQKLEETFVALRCMDRVSKSSIC